jgi:hypothetical protein
MVTMHRRGFLAASLSLSALAATRRVRAAEGKRTLRVLGRTGLEITEVGMGVMLTSEPAVVRAALDAGITYFDTARSYMGGRNEEILAEGLKGRRQEAVLATKCHRLGSRDSVLRSAEESLRALKTDHIDVFQLHGLSDRQGVLHEGHREALASLKKSGKIRFAGVTTHTGMVEVMKAAVEAETYDVVLTVLNFQSPPDLVAAVERTAAAGLGVVAMKVMSGGYQMAPAPGLSPYQSALRWVLGKKGVACAIPSMTTLEQMRDDAAVMGTTLGWRDHLQLRYYAAATADRLCRMCGACRGQCPRGASIPDALRGLMYHEGYGSTALARETLATASIPCGACGSCRVTCRFGLPLRERLLQAKEVADHALA